MTVQAIHAALLARDHAAPEPTLDLAKASLGAVECGLWLGAHDREARQYHLHSH